MKKSEERTYRTIDCPQKRFLSEGDIQILNIMQSEYDELYLTTGKVIKFAHEAYENIRVQASSFTTDKEYAPLGVCYLKQTVDRNKLKELLYNQKEGTCYLFGKVPTAIDLQSLSKGKTGILRSRERLAAVQMAHANYQSYWGKRNSTSSTKMLGGIANMASFGESGITFPLIPIAASGYCNVINTPSVIFHPEEHTLGIKIDPELFGKSEIIIHLEKKSSECTPIQMRITGIKQGDPVVHYTYWAPSKETRKDSVRIMGCDLGSSNLLSLVDNTGEVPLVVKGKSLKNLISYKKYVLRSWEDGSKKSGKLNKLENKIENELNQIVAAVVKVAKERDIDTFVVGRNKGWKANKKSDGTRNPIAHGIFKAIPHYRILNKLQWKLELEGIKYIEHEESYTSKVDHLAGEPMKAGSYSGKRVKRGLFLSSTGMAINADINGAIGIARKVFGDSFVQQLSRSSLGRTTSLRY